jgi:uncharacterized membrane protein
MSTIRLELQRHLASTRHERLSVFAAIAGLSFAFALFLGWFVGAWMIVPFAGLEVGCVAIAFWWIERKSEDRDTIEIGDSSVSVTRQRGARSESFLFSRAWVQIDIEQDRLGRERGLRFRQSGRSISFGEYLHGQEQRNAARQIKSVLASPQFAR